MHVYEKDKRTIHASEMLSARTDLHPDNITFHIVCTR